MDDVRVSFKRLSVDIGDVSGMFRACLGNVSGILRACFGNVSGILLDFSRILREIIFHTGFTRDFVNFTRCETLLFFNCCLHYVPTVVFHAPLFGNSSGIFRELFGNYSGILREFSGNNREMFGNFSGNFRERFGNYLMRHLYAVFAFYAERQLATK